MNNLIRGKSFFFIEESIFINKDRVDKIGIFKIIKYPLNVIYKLYLNIFSYKL